MLVTWHTMLIISFPNIETDMQSFSCSDNEIMDVLIGENLNKIFCQQIFYVIFFDCLAMFIIHNI